MTRLNYVDITDQLVSNIRYFLKKKKKRKNPDLNICLAELANLGKWLQERQMSNMHAQDDRSTWIIFINAEPISPVLQTFKADFTWDEWKPLCLAGSEREHRRLQWRVCLYKVFSLEIHIYLQFSYTLRLVLDSWGPSHMQWLVKTNSNRKCPWTI